LQRAAHKLKVAAEKLPADRSACQEEVNMKKALSSLAGAVVVAVTILAAGCGTAQTPNAQVQDTKITGEVKSKLVSDVRPSSLANIDVNTTNGVVTMAGQVESDQVRQRAVEVARSVKGVVRVNDNLQVEPKGVAQQQESDHHPPQ
jgi:osmotically-inducible protein OsmY